MLPRLRKIEAGAIAAFESRYVDLHFFAFELGGDAHDSNHGIGLPRRGNSLQSRIGAHVQPHQFRTKAAAEIFDLYGIAMPFLQRKVDCLCEFGSCKTASSTINLPSSHMRFIEPTRPI